jgi:hypothetical protein
MTKRKRNDLVLIGDIQPGQSYRTTLSPVIFGVGWQSMKDKIKAGELPTPFRLSPSSRFEAWTGQQIIDHREKMQKIAVAELEAERAATAAVQPQPKALADAVKIRKQKLRPPAKSQQREHA